MMKYVLCAALSLVLIGCGGGSPLTLNQENLDKIHDDMSPSEVQAILGAPTDSNSRATTAESSTLVISQTTPRSAQPTKATLAIREQ